MGEGATKPGLLWVNFKVAKPELTDDAKFLHWYDNEHAPEILKSSAFDSNIRGNAMGAWRGTSADRPYLSIYPTRDASFFESHEFTDISHMNKNLPGSGNMHDLADWDVRWYEAVEVYDPTEREPGWRNWQIHMMSEIRSLIGDD